MTTVSGIGRSIIAVVLLTVSAAMSARSTARQDLGRPDLAAIERETTDENSSYYYPKLLQSFLSNDTTMTAEEFQYFYYGTLFQEDYDPYRGSPNPELLEELAPIYAKQERTRADRLKMQDYATQVILDNPVDLRQLTNRIYVYEQNKKRDLAKIWQYKLNHLLLVIAASGTGLDADNAWIVVYPQHEYDFLNISGQTATGQRFEPPHYDYITVTGKGGEQAGYYFDISELLRQYFLKHPSELRSEGESGEDVQVEEENINAQ